MKWSILVALLLPLMVVGGKSVKKSKKKAKKSAKKKKAKKSAKKGKTANPDNLLLSETCFLQAHDAATIYLELNYEDVFGAISKATKTQATAGCCQSGTDSCQGCSGTISDLFDSGVRSLDWRPELTQTRADLGNGECTQPGRVYMHHGDVLINVLYEDALQEAMTWVENHPG